MSPVRNDPSVAKEHAILADRVFDGHRWHPRSGGDGPGRPHCADWALGLMIPKDLAADAAPSRHFLAPGFIDLAGQRRWRRSSQRSADGGRHARHCAARTASLAPLAVFRR